MMAEAFKEGDDIHAATAAKVYKISIDKVTREQRSKAKTANFGIIYGISVFGLAERMNVDRKEAKELIDGYFETYPQIKEYMDKSIDLARGQGYIETISSGYQFQKFGCARICRTKCHQCSYPGKCSRYYQGSYGTHIPALSI